MRTEMDSHTEALSTDVMIDCREREKGVQGAQLAVFKTTRLRLQKRRVRRTADAIFVGNNDLNIYFVEEHAQPSATIR